MTNWLFVTKIPTEEFEELLTSKKWPIKKTTRYKNVLASKDNVIFYRGLPHGKQFVGSCILESIPKKIETGIAFLKLSNVKKWKNGIAIQDHLNDLELIRKKKMWQIYIMGGIVKLSDKDFKKILSFAKDKP